MKMLSLKYKGKRILAFVLSFLMVNSVIDYPGLLTANAANNSKDYTITTFDELNETQRVQVLSIGAKESDILFPVTLKATVEYTAVNEPDEKNTETEDISSEDISDEDISESPTEESDTEESDTEASTGADAQSDILKSNDDEENDINADNSSSGSDSDNTDASDMQDADSNNIASALADTLLGWSAPMTVYAAENTATDSNAESINETETKEITLTDITWQLDAEESDGEVFDSSEAANGYCYVYEPVLPKTDSEGNSLTVGAEVTLPEIYVQIGESTALMLASDSNVLDVSTLQTQSITFGAGYSDYIVIDSDNVKDFDGKTLTGTTTSGIFINNYTTVNLTIEDLNITKSANISSCISVGYGAALNLTVKGENMLNATGWGGAGIEVMGQTKATLRITSDSTGTLNAKGGYGSSLYGSYGGAGIGGMARITSDIKQVYVGDIIIEGGTINATGGYQAAGIGGTIGESGGIITITGGRVNAVGGYGGAGIGGGSNGNVDSITIEGGTVTATAGGKAAAIGAGYCGASSAANVFSFGNISINRGDVTANGNIGYGSFYNESYISGGSGMLSVSENVYIDVTGEVKTGNGDSGSSTTVNKYTVNFTVYDGRFMDDTFVKIKLGDTVLTESATAEFQQIGKLSVSFNFTTGSLTGGQSFTLTIDDREYQETIVFAEGTTSYAATIGTPLYPVTLEFYDEAITSDFEAESVIVKQNNVILSADNGEYYTPDKLSKVENYYGTMLLYLPANSGSTEISVTASALNTGRAMEKSGQTISDTDTNRIVMLESEQMVLRADVESKGATTLDAKLTLNTVGTTVYYVKSETAITNAAEIENADGVASTTVENASTTVSLSGSAEDESTYYFVAKKEDAYSNIASLTFTTNGEAKVKIQGEETESYYDNWYNAIEAARGKTATVTLLCSRKKNYEAIKSVTIKDGDNITIDMNGCEYRSYINNMTAPLIMVEGGKCTITGDGNLYAFASRVSSIRMLYITGGEVVIDGNLKIDTIQTYCSLDNPIHVNGENAILRITGGVTIGAGYDNWSNSWKNSICAEKAKEISITNGRYESPVQLEDVKTVSISGGRFGGYNGNGINIVSAESVSISGGTFREYIYSDGLALNIEDADRVLISGGTFKKAVSLRNGSLSGGTFSNTLKLTDSDGSDRTNGDDLSSLLAVGYTYRQSDNTTTKGEGTYALSNVSVVETAKTSIEGATVTLGTDTVIYSGEAQTPAVSSVVLDNMTLTENTDYTVSYENNVDAGTATVIITGAGENYNGSVTKTFTITKKPVTVSGITARDKTYNGTTDAVLDCSTAVFDGVNNTDKGTLIVRSATGIFDDANAGANKTVTISNITLGGTSAGNYVLADSGNQTKASATINPRTVSLSWSENTSFTYNGREQGVTATVSNGIGSDSFTLTYENSGTNTNIATEVGSYTAKVTSLGNNNYTLEGAVDVSKDWSISYLVAGDAVLSGATGGNGWYTSTVTLTPPDGYSISTDKNDWQNTLTVDTEGTQTVSYYLKNAEGSITDKKTAAVKLDTVAPTGEIKIKDNSFSSFLNTITFGYFFKETVNVSITGTDATSSVKTIEYQKVAASDDYDANGAWTTGSSFSVEPREKFIVYARITDNAGNRTIINSEGVVVYTDVAYTAAVAFTKTSTEDVNAGITLNGNTVATITNGRDTVAADAYEVSNDKLVLKASYLDTLAAGTYTLTVSYHPLGETYTGGTSVGVSPQTTEITLTVKKAGLTVAAAPALSGIYGTKVEDMFIDTTSARLVNASGTEVNGTWSVTDANKSNIPGVGATAKYELTFTPDSDMADRYDSITTTVVPTVSRKAVSVTIKDVTRKYKEANPSFAYALTDGSTLAGDDTLEMLGVTTSTEADENSNAGEYAIKGAAVNENYDVSVISGTLTVTKAAAPGKVLENKNYIYTIGSNGNTVTVDVAGKLPTDRGTTSYAVSTSDADSILEDTPEVDADGNLTYQVKGNTTAGQAATITVTATMQNYEDATYILTINAIDKTVVSEKSGSEVAISGSNALTYGQKLSELTLNTEMAVFVERNTDTVVTGKLTWKNPDEIPVAGTTTATWVFIPENSAEYAELEGTVAISVAKAVPALTAPTVMPAAYNRTATLENAFTLTGGNAKHTIGGVETEVAGSFCWQNGETSPTVDNKGYIVVFTPADSTNYECATVTATVTITKATPTISTYPAATPLTYEQSLSDSMLSGGEANTAGSFAWTNENLKPSVSDSNSTEYDVTFTPSDGVNYSTASCQIKITVNKAENAPNMPGVAMNVSNHMETVGDVSLSDYADWEWQDSDKDTKLTVGAAVTATALYTGTDKDNYEKISVEVAITRSICKHEHTELRNESAAACWKEGYTGDTYCKECGELVTSGQKISKTNHTVGTAATCRTQAVCSVCGERFGNLDVTNHEETELRNFKKASCTETGYTGDTYCKACDTLISSGTSIASTGHTWDSGTVTKEPTTLEEGVRLYTCTICGETKTETIAKKQDTGESGGSGSGSREDDKDSTPSHIHSYSSTVTKQATCTDDGVRTYICSCGATYRENIPAAGHSYTSEVTKEPTSMAEGVMTYTCKNCGHSYTQAIAKLLDNSQGNTDRSINDSQGNTDNTDDTKPEAGKPFIKEDNRKIGWNAIKSQIKTAQAGDSIKVDMNGSTTVPKDIFETLKDKDITIIFDMGENITWAVNGKDITRLVGDIDFGISCGNNAKVRIPIDVINNITGERYSMNLTLAYDGEFGFTAVLTINLDKKNAGLYANLFYFNEQTGELEFICADEIDENGNTRLTFTHASDYIVVVDDKAMSSEDAEVTNTDSTFGSDDEKNSSTEVNSAKTGNTWLRVWLIVLGTTILVLGIGIMLILKKKKETSD